MSYSAKFASCLYGPFRFVPRSPLPFVHFVSLLSLHRPHDRCLDCACLTCLLNPFPDPTEKQPAQSPTSATESATSSLPMPEDSLDAPSFVPPSPLLLFPSSFSLLP